jgi:hypothetical protein
MHFVTKVTNIFEIHDMTLFEQNKFQIYPKEPFHFERKKAWMPKPN